MNHKISNTQGLPQEQQPESNENSNLKIVAVDGTIHPNLVNGNDEIVLEPLEQNPYVVSYTCLLLPRLESHYLLGEVANCLQTLIRQISTSFEWHLEFLSIKPDYLQCLDRSFTSALVAALTILAILGARRILPNLPLPQRILILMPLITYPLIYYLVPYMARYRMPIDWILFLLACVEIWYWIHFITRRIAEVQAITVNGSAGAVEMEMKEVWHVNQPISASSFRSPHDGTSNFVNTGRFD